MAAMNVMAVVANMTTKYRLPLARICFVIGEREPSRASRNAWMTVRLNKITDMILNQALDDS